MRASKTNCVVERVSLESVWKAFCKRFKQRVLDLLKFSHQMILPNSSEKPATTKDSENVSADNVAVVMPAKIRATLSRLGINGDAILEVQSDLDDQGRWNDRFLVATSDRVIVLSSPADNASSTRDGEEAKIEFDAPLHNILSTEAKAFVGSAALEARVRVEGSFLNGHSPSAPATERVVELLRSSNSRAKELNNAARVLDALRKGETNDATPEEDAKWQRQTCPNCKRPLPEDSNVCPFCVNKLDALKRLLNYLGPYKWMAIGNGLLAVLAIGLSFLPLVIFKELIDSVLKPASAFISTPAQYRELSFLIGLIVLGQMAGAAISVLRGRTQAFLGANVIHDIRTQVYAQLQRLSLAYYDKREVGAVMSRVQNDTGMLQNFLLDGAENMILAALTILGVVVIMFWYSWQLALLVLVPVPFVVFATNTYWRGLMKLWRRVWHQTSSLNARLSDSLSGVRVVRAFAQEDREVGRYVGKSGELRDATQRVESKAANFYPILGFVMGLGGPIVWYFGGRQVLDGVLTFGALFLFTGLLQRLYEPIQQLTRLVNFTTRAMTAAERVFEVLDTDPEIKERPDAVAMKHLRGDVEFRGVTFGYDRYRPVLHNIEMKVREGEMIGLVGHSGAGKSTLINLLMRFYDVDEGAITVDGVDIRDIKRDDIRRQVGVVLQEPYLFHGTVFDNIAYGAPHATPAQVMAAAKAAFAHDFIVNFPDGYDTLVGERGTRLSGGERQRISIARAILHDPRILILDEATASIDTQTELQIQQALGNLVKGRTTFAIAHRLSTLRNADRLLVLEGGRIVEQGTHDELMDKRGVFYKLINAQKAINELQAVGG